MCPSPVNTLPMRTAIVCTVMLLLLACGSAPKPQQAVAQVQPLRLPAPAADWMCHQWPNYLTSLEGVLSTLPLQPLPPDEPSTPAGDTSLTSFCQRAHPAP